MKKIFCLAGTLIVCFAVNAQYGTGANFNPETIEATPQKIDLSLRSFTSIACRAFPGHCP